MNLRKRVILYLKILLITGFPLLLVGQQQNPFDLYHRLEHIKTRQDTGTQSTRHTPDTILSKGDSLKTTFPADTTIIQDRFPVLEDTITTESRMQKETQAVSPDTIYEKKTKDTLLPDMLQSRRNLIFSTFIILALFLTVVISFNRSVVNKVIRSILNDNYLNLLYREQKGRWSMQYIFLYIFFIANFALFLFLMIDLWEYNKIHANLLYLCGILSLVYITRHFSLNLIGNTFPISKETGQFNFTIMLFNIFLGLILLPINLFIAFAPISISNTFLYIGLGIIILFYLLRQLRGLFIGARFIMHNKFHFLLYLCTVEIAPMAVLYKFFQPFFT